MKRTRDGRRVEKELKGRIRGEVFGDVVHRALYSTAACIYRIQPLAVILPRDAEDVVRSVEYARAEGIPLTARGAGTGLAGQTLGTGLILDFSRYMRGLLAVDFEGSRVRVQPGLVLGDLNRVLKGYGKFFPPDPSSGEHCTLGGMIANNASGAHSIRYGATKDYLLDLSLVLSDSRSFWTREAGKRAPDLTGRIREVVRESRTLIEEKAPRSRKNSSGYNLREVLRGEGEIDLNPLLAGSEGTLALVTEAWLRVVDLPAEVGSALLYFADLERATDAVPEISALGPSVLEIMDRSFLDLVREGDRALGEELPPGTRTLLLVEFEGQTPSEIQEKVRRMQERVEKQLGLAFACRCAFDPQEQTRLWAIRKAASPLLNRMEREGEKRPARFIEDVAVEPAQLSRYIQGLHRILEKYQAPGVIFGHAGDGNIHVNPQLDLRCEEGVRRLERIAAETYALAKELKGTLSGEHGDGRLRTSFLKEMYGELCQVFRQVKEAFDPSGILNPGIIVPLSERESLTHHLRFGPGDPVERGEGRFRLGLGASARRIRRPPEKETEMAGTALSQPSLLREIEKCHGCGYCKDQCPLFREVGGEGATPRAKVNLMRELLSGRLGPASLGGSQGLGRAWGTSFEAFPRLRTVAPWKEMKCLNCKRCRQECPLEIDIPRLSLAARGISLSFPRPSGRGPLEAGVEILARRHRPWGSPLADPAFLARTHRALGPLAEAFLGSSLGRRILQGTLGLHRDRILPEVHRNGFPEGREGRGGGEDKIGNWKLEIGNWKSPGEAVGEGRGGEKIGNLPNRKVAYFEGCFARYYSPEIGRVLVELLEQSGCEVIFPPQRCCGLPKLSAGDFYSARADARHNLKFLQEAVDRGYQVVTTCPSCAMALKVEYRELWKTPEADAVARNTVDALEYLLALDGAKLLGEPRRALEGAVAYHASCHLKALGLQGAGLALLQRCPGLSVHPLSDRCCGMAGSFGLSKENFSLSMEIGKPLFQEIRALSPQQVATSCGACQIQIYQGTAVHGVHPVILLHQAYGNAKEKR
ncbi:MAG: FAD-binding protein [Nitrospinae bacterium]|nr:FAD-binding protein [Nitrospinota bacterium]